MLLEEIIDFVHTRNFFNGGEKRLHLALQDLSSEYYAPVVGLDVHGTRVRHVAPEFGAYPLHENVVGNIARAKPVLRLCPRAARTVREIASRGVEAVSCFMCSMDQLIANHSAAPCASVWIDKVHSRRAEARPCQKSAPPSVRIVRVVKGSHRDDLHEDK
jgi:hypothetical protein